MGGEGVTPANSERIFGTGDLSENFYKVHEKALGFDEFTVFAGGLSMKLKRGMTFVLEHEFVFPDRAVGIENTFVLGENSVKKLTIFEGSIIKI